MLKNYNSRYVNILLMELFDVIVIGGGPVGLYAAKEIEKRGKSFLLLEGEDFLGGQITRLYPKKIVVDVPLFKEGPAEDIISALINGIHQKDHLLTNQRVLSLEEKKPNISIKTPSNSYLAKNVIVTTGLGISTPRKLNVKGEEGCKEVLYELKDPLSLKGKEVIVFGGGDSALDWARDLSYVAKKVSLVHRRNEFRGNPKTIENVPINLYMSYVPEEVVLNNGHLKSVIIKKVDSEEKITIEADFVLVNFGQIPSPSTFSLPISEEGFGLLGDLKTHKIKDNIYAAGDVLFYKDKKKRMVPGFLEVDAILNEIF